MKTKISKQYYHCKYQCLCKYPKCLGYWSCLPVYYRVCLQVYLQLYYRVCQKNAEKSKDVSEQFQKQCDIFFFFKKAIKKLKGT